MHYDLVDLCRLVSTVETKHTLKEIKDTSPDCEPPCLVSKAVTWLYIQCVTDKASSSVRVQAQEEKECEVMRVPESFKALVANLVMGSRVHEQHKQQHGMTCDSSSFGVMDLPSFEITSQVCLFDIEEIDIMGADMDHSEEENLIRDLSMEPDVLVHRDKSLKRWSNESHEVTADWEQNNSAIETKYQTGTTREPYGILKRIETG